MTLQEILDDVDGRVANAVATSQKVKWINQIQRQLFREYPLPEAVDKFSTVSGVQFYPMPDKCVEGRITHLTVNGVEYLYQAHFEEAKSKFWTIVAGQIMLYPIPDGAYDVLVYYKPRHNELSETRLTEIPNFPEDYHELLVLGCAKRVAQVQRDVDLANNFEADFRELSAKADKEFRKQSPRRITMLI
jgi:hypothetical protein